MNNVQQKSNQTILKLTIENEMITLMLNKFPKRTSFFYSLVINNRTSRIHRNQIGLKDANTPSANRDKFRYLGTSSAAGISIHKLISINSYFWFLSRNDDNPGFWFPGIVAREMHGQCSRLIWKKLFNLVSRHFWFFLRINFMKTLKKFLIRSDFSSFFFIRDLYMNKPTINNEANINLGNLDCILLSKFEVYTLTFRIFKNRAFAFYWIFKKSFSSEINVFKHHSPSDIKLIDSFVIPMLWSL